MIKFKYIFPVIGLLAFPELCSANIVSNGGFENGLTGWTLSGDSSWTNAKSVFPHSGSQAAHIGAFGDAGDGYLTQAIATTLGASYTVSFWYGEYNENDPFGPWGYLAPGNVNTTDPNNFAFQANSLTVKWDGTAGFADAGFLTSGQNLTAQGDGFWKFGSFDFQATGASTNLSFGAFDRQQDVVIDDITVTAQAPTEGAAGAQAPEPATLGLLGSALIGIGLLKRKRTTRS